MSYPLGIVGESNYQKAIRACRAGQRAFVVREVGNPYDEQALVVASETGEKIGYIPKSSWLQQAVHFEGKGCSATIKAIETGDAGFWAVVLDVELNAGGIAECQYE